MYYVVGALRRCGVRGGGVRKTFTLAAASGSGSLVSVSVGCRALSTEVQVSIWQVFAPARHKGLFPFFSPPDAKTRLRRVHYGPKIAVLHALACGFTMCIEFSTASYLIAVDTYCAIHTIEV